MKSTQRIFLPILSLALAANLAFAVAPDSDIPQRKRQSPTAVRVVSANIRFPAAADAETGNDWDRRKKFARDVLLAQDADVICFQEFRKDHLQYLKKYFRDYEVFGLVDTDEGEKSNTIFFSKKRFEKVSHAGAFLSPTPGVYRSHFEESVSVRHVAGLHLKDRLTGEQILVWNTHLDHKSQVARDKQAGVLMTLIKQAPPNIPQVITGDFNCAARTKAIKTILASGFVDSYAVLHGPADPGNTFHSFRGADYGNRTGKIDFVFSNAPLRPVATEIIKDSHIVKGVRRYPSDHYFISAEFEYVKTKK
ncbi:endonuclease/exonuclease/phosphatase family metal-dependent hydrolase [Ereboglobus sp. PH5-10]|uniref:endonuclease/exonuclease/phosphatase family protein n=1 Tax=Ereboglobus sp. PH5-10 TaxID=2940629 RepID=UPI002406D75E|nr:endonuclease/exonuclease/phosphatase family protein [Ereboglobus sp. PH5-10]MDF9827148.1 endonuclease/exonuclease/phosphatase family metal-dependent hydrolase [Ereboglobus sp. PH5-10]